MAQVQQSRAALNRLKAVSSCIVLTKPFSSPFPLMSRLTCWLMSSMVMWLTMQYATAPTGLSTNIHLIRHSFSPGVYDASHVFGAEDPLQGPQDLAQERVLDYTRSQNISTRRFPADPARYWVILIADGQRRSRLYGTFENHGEVLAERTETRRYWDLRPSNFLAPLVGRLVVEWDNPRTWHRRAVSAANLPVLEIADRGKVLFPGFDRVLLTHHELCEMTTDHRYADWWVALSEVQGIYVITDSSNGKQYVGKADGAERILQRWTSYARDGHGGNLALRELAFASVGTGEGGRVKTDHARHFVFRILRVFGPSHVLVRS